MASVKLILRANHARKDGRTPVIIQIIHERKSKIITLFSINPDYWDYKNNRVKRSCTDHVLLNNKIVDDFMPLQKRLLELELSGVKFTIDDIMNEHSGRVSDQIDKYVVQVLEGANREASTRKYTNLKKHIKAYNNERIDKVDDKYFAGFEKYLYKIDTINSAHTVTRYLKSLRTVIRSAWKEGKRCNLSAVNYKVSSPTSEKQKLSRGEVEMLRSKKLKMPLSLYRDAALLCYDSWGSRIGDVLMLGRDNIQGDRITFTEQKTGKRKSVKLSDNIRAVKDRYDGMSPYILPIMDIEKTDEVMNTVKYRKRIESKTALINRGLKVIAALCGIEINLSTHIMRHSFSAHAIKSGVSVSELRSMLNHSTTAVTEDYVRGLFRDEELDEVAVRVYG